MGASTRVRGRQRELEQPKRNKDGGGGGGGGGGAAPPRPSSVVPLGRPSGGSLFSPLSLFLC